MNVHLLPLPETKSSCLKIAGFGRWQLSFWTQNCLFSGLKLPLITTLGSSDDFSFFFTQEDRHGSWSKVTSFFRLPSSKVGSEGNPWDIQVVGSELKTENVCKKTRYNNGCIRVVILPETNSLVLKMAGWETLLSFWGRRRAYLHQKQPGLNSQDWVLNPTCAFIRLAI